AALNSELLELGDPALEVIAMDSEAAVGAKGSANGNGGALVDITMVVFNGNEELSLSFLQAQKNQPQHPAFFAVLRGRSSSLMKRALRAGADEILFLPLEPGDVTRALLKVSEARWRSDRREGGIVCSLTSVVGGVGVTSLTANLGLAMCNAMGKRVALVDLDYQSGGLAVCLNLEPEMTVMPLIRFDRKLDSIQLESALTKHPSGLYVLAAPKRIEESELISDITVATVLDLMRQLFDVVIVDCGDHVDENAVCAWERSDHLIYVLNQSIAAARCAWRFIDLFERLGLSSLEPRFVLNNHRASHPISDKQIESTLARPIYARIPADDRIYERIEMTGKDLWHIAPKSQLARAVEELAGKMFPAEEGHEMESGLMSKLFSTFAARS
ncbi:MAG TPA: AAA family ATPase, partial [Candidatus Binataceae bacterium]